jgi:dihydrofolate reductase
VIILIAAVARNGVIGVDGELPWVIPADMRRFKAKTMGHPVIMGRRTFESIGHPLRGRRNIVLSRRPGYDPKGVEVAANIDSATAIAATHNTDTYVIGGAAVYKEFLPIAERMELTCVDAAPRGDARFPEWEPRNWQRVANEPHDGDPPFRFVTLQRQPANGTRSTSAPSATSQLAPATRE